MNTQSGDMSGLGLGRAIAAARTLKGMKRADLARAAGISYPYLSEIENGGKSGSTKAITKIANALGMTTAELFAVAETQEAGGDVSDVLGTSANQRPSAPRPDAGYLRVETSPTSLAEAVAFATGPGGHGRGRLGGTYDATRDFEDQMVRRVMAQVRAEILQWLEVELEPAVRSQVRAAISSLSEQERGSLTGQRMSED